MEDSDPPQAKIPVQPADSILSNLKEAMKQAVERGRITSELRVWLEGEELEKMSWRSIHVGAVETLIRINREADLLQLDRVHKSVDERTKASGELYDPSAYRKLSNGKLLFLHMNAVEHKKYTFRLLEALGLPTGVLQIEYQGSIYKLP